MTGTKADFQAWLLEVKKLSLTKYHKLERETKLLLQKEYLRKRCQA